MCVFEFLKSPLAYVKEDCDATRISRIIEDASKGSSYYENEQRKQQRTQVAIEKMLKRVSAASATELRRAEQKVWFVVLSVS